MREVKGAQIVKEVSECEAKIVADPTLLLTREEWTNLIPEKKIVKTPYIFCYFLGENVQHREVAEQLKEATGLQIVCTPYLDSFVERDMTFGDKQLFDIGPDDFINLIRGAEYILTDSFHGSVFSILHHKKFVIFNRFTDGKHSRNSRIDSLCKLLDLEVCRFRGNVVLQIYEPIKYTSVDEKLHLLRSESLEFLQSALS